MISTSLLIVALLAPQMVLPGDRELGFISDPDGTTRAYRVTYAALAKAPAWDPEQGPPPLSLARATQLGRKWLTLHNPKFESFRPSRFTIERVSEGNGRQEWVWQISFDPRFAGLWLDQPGFEVYLLMDGTVVVPTVSKGKPFTP